MYILILKNYMKNVGRQKGNLKIPSSQRNNSKAFRD